MNTKFKNNMNARYSSLVDATDLQKFPVKLNTILARELKKKLV